MTKSSGVASYPGLSRKEALARQGSEISIRKLGSSYGPDSPITKRQLFGLQFIFSYFEENGWWPDLREIAAAMAMPGTRGSTNNAAQLLDRLVMKGYLYVHPKTARAMRITLKGYEALGK